ncbi:SGNH/GDSL hydrolase family protein [Luteolibacter sp. GHJ8]|uniref:SGNH/GDSL hydrolase family protein n=1 Tax=Luteolibacter rhizosphaerae TaxID=2989719 RepID=A0ABT3G5E7_9BACT|nr:SGNH/GDSL hydrolase family protein [Luteolibacter rhizosphaerae]MCW1914450.1 SGNH/GDSL hydrolase family protein [Luteolibacter rhizosphaerae]
MRTFGWSIIAICIASLGLHAQEPAAPRRQANAGKRSTPEPALSWHDVKGWGLEGRAFGEMERKNWFDRLPAAAEGKVTKAVWQLGQDTSGMLVRFKTDATVIWANYQLRRPNLALPNITAIAASGLDLYAKDPKGQWRWAGVTRPNSKHVRQEIIKGMSPGMREYMLYLPIKNGIEKLEIGLPPDAKFEPVAPRTEKPIVFYGTSITHGASASRPGMTHTAILGRRLDRPVINLGFSGNGRMDAAVGDLLVKIDAAVYVIDCLPNMNADAVRRKCIPLVKQLRAAKPDVPILLVEDRRNTNSWLLPERNKHHDANHLALRECMEKLKAEGITGLHYLPGDALLGDDGEAATDGSHPSDLGFVRQADQFEPLLKACLAPK